MKTHQEGRFSDPGSDFGELERAAAEWVVRQQQSLTFDEQAEFDRWLRRDPRHAGIYAEMSETSVLLNQLHDPSSANFSAAPRRRFWVAGSKAWRVPALLAVAAAIAVIGGLRLRPVVTPVTLVQTVTAEKGSLRKLDLPDGSVVQLNVESAVEVLYLPQERRVRLTRGEAHFTVAHDPSRPFIVTASGVAVRAVGTAFDVRYGAGAVEVLVTHGQVHVTDAIHGGSLLAPSHEPPLLVAGQYLQIPLERAAGRPLQMPAIQVDSAELQRRMAWKDQRLEFSAVSLAEVVAEFNRHNEHQLKIADPSLAELRFGGAFTPHGHEALVELLEQSFGVVAERRERETILRRK